MTPRTVWRNPSFVWLIGGQTVSEFGSAVSTFAIPWLLLQLTGSALQMGLAFAVGFVPYLLVALPAGVWADRHNRKHLMMIADVVRTVLMLSIPAAHLFAWLTAAQLYVVLALMGIFNALFDASYVSCLPNLVGKDQLHTANSAIQASTSASQILGPALAGAAIAVVGTANTIFADAASYAISAATLFLIRGAFSRSDTQRIARDGMLRQIGEGLRYVWNNTLIRSISLFTLAGNLGGAATGALILYRLQFDLHASASLSGLVMAGVSVGVIVGSLLSGLLTKRVRMGHIMMIALLLFPIPDFITALTRVPQVIGVANVLLGIAMVLWNVQSMSLRQSVIPDEMLGRASSSIRMLVWGSIPVGNVIGGAAGQWFGTSAVFASTGIISAIIWLAGWRTPLYGTVRTPETTASAPPTTVNV